MIIEPISHLAIADAWAESEATIGRALGPYIERAGSDEIVAMWQRIEWAWTALAELDHARLCVVVDSILAGVCRVGGLGAAWLEVHHDAWQFERLRWLGLQVADAGPGLFELQCVLIRALADGNESAAQRAVTDYMEATGSCLAVIERDTPWFWHRGHRIIARAVTAKYRRAERFGRRSPARPGRAFTRRGTRVAASQRILRGSPGAIRLRLWRRRSPAVLLGAGQGGDGARGVGYGGCRLRLLSLSRYLARWPRS
jgi:hypothetical protein